MSRPTNTDPAAKGTAKFYKLDQALAARRDVRTSDKVILAVISDSLGRNGQSWIGIRSIARLAGVDPKTANQAVARLEAKALIFVERRGNGRGHHYRLPDQTVGETPTLSGEHRGRNRDGRSTDRGRNADAAVGEVPTEARENLPPNQTDSLTRQKKSGAAALARVSTKPPPDPRVKQVLDQFCQLYQKATGRKYVVSGAKEGGILKKLLGALDAQGVVDVVGELMRAAGNMLADPWGAEKASIGLLSTQINVWRGNGDGSSPAPKRAEFTRAPSSFDYSTANVGRRFG